MSDIEKIINDAWENKNQVSQNSNKSVIDSVHKRQGYDGQAPAQMV